MILSIDLGTSLTKVGLWSQDGLVALGRSRLETIHGADGQAEQDASRWWASVQEATRQAFSVLSTDGGGTEVEAIGFSTARQTFVPVDRHCRPLGNALLWNDRRAAAEAAILIEALGGQAALRQRTGIYYDAGSVAAKMAWLACNDPARLKSASWLVGPRDLVAFELTGEVVSDVTVASASGLYDSAGVPLADVLQAAMSMESGPASGLASPRRDPAALLPRPVGSDCIVGWLLADAAAQLGLAAGIPVIAGAGDRQCEILGTGASAERPMVSWGTTANVSMPVDTLDPGRGDGLIATRAAGPGWLLEGGLSGAGSLLEWLSGLLGLPAGDLVAGAHRRPAGANGVVVLPWLGGARAPWWRPEAAASVLGLSASSDPFDVARAAMEGVAYDIARCLESGYGKAGAARSSAGTLECLALGGSGASLSPWVEVLTAVTGVRAIRRRSGEAASAGAALLAAAAVGIELELDRMDPLAEVVEPVPADVAAYERLRPRADRLAAAGLSAAAFARPN